MQSEFIVNEKERLKKIDNTAVWQRVIAIVLSYIFHPVFIPVYVTYLFLFIQPFLFVGVRQEEKVLTLIQSFLMYTFFPLISIFLLKGLKFISSITLKERKDRIIPFIICNIWYFWIWYVWRNLSIIPNGMVVFAFGIFLTSSIGLLFNIYMKISMHGMALGASIAFLFYVSFKYEINLGIFLAIALFISGLVCTSRLILKDHNPNEIYCGLFVGIVAIITAGLIQ